MLTLIIIFFKLRNILSLDICYTFSKIFHEFGNYIVQNWVITEFHILSNCVNLLLQIFLIYVWVNYMYIILIEDGLYFIFLFDIGRCSCICISISV